MKRIANTRWIIDRPKNGSHIVRARATREVIGGIIPFRPRTSREHFQGIGYLATRAEGGSRDFNTRFDAAAWIMQGFDKAVETPEEQGAPMTAIPVKKKAGDGQ